ncbi:GNAT family N-acetyltransferase [Metabacillus iocasae]|uniref:Ribosomal-protein-serine acetyltransferase n=1 Tax=Priestia iocasae TaxID=2291674 RepID=A0ABS2QWW3_9BACI|nr:GNAT family protein [Metabacillus iocasae]MBM7703960.1 ribosomal-protein-serine acetyltransferase [Metabacillus iocasae]
MFELKINDELKLRLVEHEDAISLTELINESRDYLRSWLPWVDGIQHASDYDDIIPQWYNQYLDNQGFQAVIVYQNQIVGMVGFHGINWANQSTSIGYWIGERFQNKGIMTKSVVTCLSYAFAILGLHRVEIRCGVNNVKSRAIPERLGFTHEGTARDGEYLYNHYHDLAIYSLLSHEWDQLQENKASSSQ